MKYDFSKKMTKFAERALEDFSRVLFEVLSEKSIESITINELCEKAKYPRATFYNYFDDIYDLLNYCWQRMASDIAIDDYPTIPAEERTYVLFERCYTYLSAYRDAISKIMKHNPMDGRFVESLRRFIREQIYSIIVNSSCSEKYEVPYELMAEHYANTIQMMLEWSFIRRDQMSKDAALEALHYLLGGL